MAVWQYSFWGIPEQRVLEKYGNIPSEIDEDTFNTVQWFEGVDPGLIIDKLDFLPPNEHWSKEASFWGTYESDSITLWFDDGVMSELSFRVDLSGAYEDMAAAMLELLTACKLVLVREDLVVQACGAEFVNFLQSVKRFGR